MSVAVAVTGARKIVLASDSQITFGPTRMPPDNHGEVKIRQIGESYLATTGWGVYENIFDDFLPRKRIPNLNGKQRIFSFFLRFWKELHDKYSYVNDQCADKDSPFGDLDASFLLTNPSGIFHIASDMSVTRCQKYQAIGSGSDFSLGALHAIYDNEHDPELMARKAVSAAVRFNVYCGGDTVIKTVRRRRTR